MSEKFLAVVFVASAIVFPTLAFNLTGAPSFILGDCVSPRFWFLLALRAFFGIMTIPAVLGVAGFIAYGFSPAAPPVGKETSENG